MLNLMTPKYVAITYLISMNISIKRRKYEEINPSNVEDFFYITDNTYTKDEVVKMEADILKSLKFELGNPTVKTFLRRFSRIAQEDCKVRKLSISRGGDALQLEFLGYYLAELSLLDYGCVKFLPSMIAASVIFLARFILKPKRHPWCSIMQQYSGYKASDLKECVLIIHDLYLSRRGATLQAFKCVATMHASPEIPLSYFEDVQEVDISNVEDAQVVKV
ncbi:hypothetical protein PTKIN_Ptkin09bG0143700 [Pterospermum kingtungense]